MQQTLTNFTKSYTSPEVDNCIQNLNHELIDFVNVQAPIDAKKFPELPLPYFKLQIGDFIHAKVQGGIDFIKRTLLVVPEIFNTKELEQIAQKKVEEIDQKVNDKKHSLASITRKRNLIVLDPIKMKYGKWFLIVAIFVGAGDAALAFMSFSNGAYPLILALVAAISIGAVISVSHLAYAPWIKKAENSTERAIRIFIVLLIAFTLFAKLGNLRAAASNDNVSIDLSSHEISAPTPTHLNGVAISVVSFVLFAGIFYISLILWKSKMERLDEENYNRFTTDINTIKSEIEILGKEKEDLINSVIEQKSEARNKFDLLKTAIPQCKNIGNNAIVAYKQRYTRINHNIPEFFNDPVNFQYDESIQFFQSPQPDYV